MIRSRLQDAELQREQYYAALVAAESQVERLRSHESSSAQGTAVELKRGESEERQKPFSPAVSGSVNWWEFDSSDASFSISNI